jgi:hypothetical protein
MISRGIDGAIIDWYGPGSTSDTVTKLVMAEAEKHPGFSFAVMVDKGAIPRAGCGSCSAQQGLINELNYIAKTYYGSPAYLRSTCTTPLTGTRWRVPWPGTRPSSFSIPAALPMPRPAGAIPG